MACRIPMRIKTGPRRPSPRRGHPGGGTQPCAFSSSSLPSSRRSPPAHQRLNAQSGLTSAVAKRDSGPALPPTHAAAPGSNGAAEPASGSSPADRPPRHRSTSSGRSFPVPLRSSACRRPSMSRRRCTPRRRFTRVLREAASLLSRRLRRPSFPRLLRSGLGRPGPARPQAFCRCPSCRSSVSRIALPARARTAAGRRSTSIDGPLVGLMNLFRKGARR